VKASDPIPRNLVDLPPTVPLQVASRILGIGRDHAYELVRSGKYPVRVLESNGRYKVSKFDLLAYLGAVSGDS
jgi:predicted site-specific integrase-resolvase